MCICLQILTGYSKNAKNMFTVLQRILQLLTQFVKKIKRGKRYNAVYGGEDWSYCIDGGRLCEVEQVYIFNTRY